MFSMMPAGMPAATAAASKATAAPSMMKRVQGAAGAMGPMMFSQGQDPVDRLAQMGPPPQVPIAPPVQQNDVGNTLAALLSKPVQRPMPMPVVPRMSRGEMATNPPSIGSALMGAY